MYLRHIIARWYSNVPLWEYRRSAITVLLSLEVYIGRESKLPFVRFILDAGFRIVKTFHVILNLAPAWNHYLNASLIDNVILATHVFLWLSKVNGKKVLDRVTQGLVIRQQQLTCTNKKVATKKTKCCWKKLWWEWNICAVSWGFCSIVIKQMQLHIYRLFYGHEN